MISAEILLSTEKDALPALSKALSPEDLSQLVDWLNEKDDKLRYASLLTLQSRSKDSDDLYKYWDVFVSKLKSDNSYQRSIGLMMIAANVRWDKGSLFESVFDDYCALLRDEKPITVRQCIQSFEDIVPYKSLLCAKIAEILMNIDILGAKETMRKLFLTDIINILLLIRKQEKSDEIEKYISDAILGGVLDSKTKKVISAALLS
ncbi:MAG: hypothetical protein EOM51_07525 [Clostridia bacterium]|nr:hypothetical protein [Clostridia bacterium]